MLLITVAQQKILSMRAQMRARKGLAAGSDVGRPLSLVPGSFDKRRFHRDKRRDCYTRNEVTHALFTRSDARALTFLAAHVLGATAGPNGGAL